MMPCKYELVENQLYIYNNGQLNEFNLKNYSFINDLGNGANGFVVKAYNEITGRYDAIKIWSPHEKSQTAVVNRDQYLEEIRKISSLNFEQVVTIYSADIENDFFYCIMEFVDGYTLQQVIESNLYFNNLEKIEIAINVLEAIRRYQRAEIIHGDIHSKNILIKKDKQVKIIDFGVSLFTRVRNPSFSCERECVFTYNNIRKLLSNNILFPERYFDEFLIFKCCGSNPKTPKIEFDVRDFQPLIITETLLSFIHLIADIFTRCSFENDDALDDMAKIICDAPFFDINSIIKSIHENTNGNKPICTRFFCKVSDYIDEALIPVDQDEDFYFTSMFLYYDFIKNHNNFLQLHANNSLIHWKCIVNDNDYISFAKDIMSSNLNSFIDINEVILKCVNNQQYCNFIDFLRSLFFNYILNCCKEREIPEAMLLYFFLQRLYPLKSNKIFRSEVDRFKDNHNDMLEDSDYNSFLSDLGLKIENSRSLDQIKELINL